MKNYRKLIIGASFVAMISFGFVKIKMGAIRGQVAPGGAVGSIYLIEGIDTLARNSDQQNFTFNNLKEGVYSILVKGNNNYRDSLIKSVAVKDSSTTDLGLIKLITK
ncbi:hypothetical protein ABIB40_002310 [Pedobacter sp. UYP30]|uniref:carboxypeptidase regulatory-like domain-containing protein n=1 Tax=Pedobacter sp. UYP30 TaxID=1756400 RepID=UPI00339902B1